MQLTYTCAKSASSTDPGYTFPSYSLQIYLPMHSSGFSAASSLSSSWSEASSLLAVEYAGGSELCSACVPLHGSAGMDNKTSVGDYKIQLYSFLTCWALPTPRFSQSQILCRLYKSPSDEIINQGPLCVYACKKITYLC